MFFLSVIVSVVLVAVQSYRLRFDAGGESVSVKKKESHKC
jgi:hypothetical protein